MRLSIIIPVYNTEKSIVRCIESLLKQDLDNTEVIFVDDGSTDASAKIIQSYTNCFANFKLIQKKNSGVSSARNEGLKIANGDYIWFVDSDDTLSDNAIQILSEYIELNYDVIRFSYCQFRENLYSKNEIIEEFSGDVKEYILRTVNKKKFITSPWCQITRRSIFTHNSLVFDEKIAIHEDDDMTFKILLNSSSIVCLRDVLYNYYIHLQSITRQIHSQKKEVSWNCLWTIYSNYQSLEIKDGLVKKVIINFFVYNLLVDCYKRNLGNKKYELLIKNKKIKKHLTVFSIKDLLAKIILYVNPSLFLLYYKIIETSEY